MAQCTIFNTHKAIHTHLKKTSHKAKICRYHFLTSSIEAGSSNVWQWYPSVRPLSYNISGSSVPDLVRVWEINGALREHFVWERFLLCAKRNPKKALELCGSAPNQKSRVAHLVRLGGFWVVLSGADTGAPLSKRLKYTFPEGKRVASGKSKALL